MARRSVLTRLYHGETNVDFVGRARTWFTLSAVVIVVGLGSLLLRGLNFGIDFDGGVVWEVPAGDASVTEVRDALRDHGLGDAEITTLSSDEGTRIRVEAEPLDDVTKQRERETDVAAELADVTGSDPDDVSLNSVGPTWGSELSRKAVRALIVFLVAVTAYITFRFEFKMALATLAALVHDILVTIGVYSLTGFEVTPATVIAVLTILGFSIYDGIVVFDKVDENTRLVSSAGRMGFADMVNLSLNQTLMRSLNTSLTAVLPVGSLLIIGAWILGASTLEDFALALLIGLASGAYSSIFIASPLLALLKEREPRYRDLKRRLATRTARPTVPVPAGASASGGEASEGEDDREPVSVPGADPPVPSPGWSGAHPPRPRKKGRKR